MSIPNISNIGLINLPLVMGITTINTLTLIRKGQNMLIISEGCSKKVSNEGWKWMAYLLKNIVANHRDGENVRCYYYLMSEDLQIPLNMWNLIIKAGIQILRPLLS